jgi:hypothetical protein
VGHGTFQYVGQSDIGWKRSVVVGSRNSTTLFEPTSAAFERGNERVRRTLFVVTGGGGQIIAIDTSKIE